MSFMSWSDELSTGIPSIDEEHKTLLGLLNSFYDGLCAGQCVYALHETFDGLLLYIVTHFEHEEEYMLEANYPGFEEHKIEHERLRQRVMELHEKSAYVPCEIFANELIAFLKGWVRGHILHCDRAFGAYVSAHNSNQVAPTELELVACEELPSSC